MKERNEQRIRMLCALLEKWDFTEEYRNADRIRKEQKGDYIDIRAILEFSNVCRRKCRYCGLNAENRKIKRYRMQPDEMIRTAWETAKAGYRTMILQSGEDPWYTPEILGNIVKEIRKTGMQVALSCGELSSGTYQYLKECGASKYLLKHETADAALYRRLHPCGTLAARIRCLKELKRLGYQTGSGFMVGLPGETLEIQVENLLLLEELKVDMAGIGPFISHPETPLAPYENGSTEFTKRLVALTRILLPACDLPATTALGALDPEEKNRIFSCGANVIMTKVTPDVYRRLYEIYPSSVKEQGILERRREVEEQIKRLNRIPR